MAKRRDWTQDELTVLTVIFFQSDFSAGDDGGSMCLQMADAFNRTPSSVDRQWRNIRDVIIEKPNTHIGALVRSAVAKYQADPVRLHKLAAFVCERNRWNLLTAEGSPSLVAGELGQDLDASTVSRVLSLLDEVLTTLEFKLFPTGKPGYQSSLCFPWTADLEMDMAVSAVATNPKFENDVEASAAAVAKEIMRNAAGVRLRMLPSGRVSTLETFRVSCGDEDFHVSLRISEMKKGK